MEALVDITRAFFGLQLISLQLTVYCGYCVEFYMRSFLLRQHDMDGGYILWLLCKVDGF